MWISSNLEPYFVSQYNDYNFFNRGEEGSSASAIRKGSRKFARKPDCMTIVQLGKSVELEIVYLETGRPNSTQDKRQRDHKKLVRFSKDSIDTTRNVSKLKRIFNQSSKRQNLSIFTINVTGIYQFISRFCQSMIFNHIYFT